MKFLIPEDELGVFADQEVCQGLTACLSLIFLVNSISMCCVISQKSLNPNLD